MALFVISSVSASGKSTIGRLLAGRFDRRELWKGEEATRG